MLLFPSKPLSVRNACSSVLRSFESTFEHASFSFESTFDIASFSFEIPFEIALLRTVHCFELYFVRLHRRRKAPYANLVYIYVQYLVEDLPWPRVLLWFYWDSFKSTRWFSMCSTREIHEGTHEIYKETHVIYNGIHGNLQGDPCIRGFM